MPRARLGPWQRLGIVVSVLWAMTASGYSYVHDSNRAADLATFEVGVCRGTEDIRAKTAKRAPDYDACWNDYPREYWLWMADWQGRMEALAILPIIAGWLLAWAALATTRWILAGRREPE